MMSETPSPDYRGILISAGIMALLGWLGIYLLVTRSLPTVGPRWLLFFLWMVTATGTSLPFIWLLQRRFRSHDPAPSRVLLRQGLEVGIYASLCLWLQINRALTLQLGLLLAVGLILIEGFLRLIERSRWRLEQ
jgi:hypothetical protein